MTDARASGQEQAAHHNAEKTTMRRAGCWNTHSRIIGALCALAIPVTLSLAATFGTAEVKAAGPAVTVEAAFKKFWDARNSQEAARSVGDVVGSGVTFQDALARLKRGRPYASNVPRKIVRLSRRSGGKQFFYDLNVPGTYDPNRRYQVRVQLHGGVMGRKTSEPPGEGSIGELAGAEQIYVLPYSWAGAPWWTTAQVENLRAILDAVKRSYNVDENRVALAGVSDGATATYYFAMRDTTPYASFLSLNGFFMVLANPATGVQDELFPNNFLNKPFFLVNGGADQFYPTWYVERYIENLQDGGVQIDYYPQPSAGHNTSWWPELKDTFESFVREHPRDPLPKTLTWESIGNPLDNRAHWLVIDRLAISTGLAPLPDLNELIQPPDDQPPSPKLITHSTPFGRVDLERVGNTVQAIAHGVAQFTLLISPDAFDLSQPIRVVVNRRSVFDGRVEPSVATLMKWAALDNDRTMLFAAELHIRPE